MQNSVIPILIDHIWEYKWRYLVGCVVVFVIYRIIKVYTTAKAYIPQPIKDIPCPKFSSPLLGHPEAMLHPLKHIVRSNYMEDMQDKAAYQLLVLTHSSVFVNKPKLAAELIKTINMKGDIYLPNRFWEEEPDLLTSDGDQYEIHRKALFGAYISLESYLDSSPIEQIFLNVDDILTSYSETEKTLDLYHFFTLFVLDYLSMIAFNYRLDSLSGSEDGITVYEALKTMLQAKLTNGLFPDEKSKSIPKDTVEAAESSWESFIRTVFDHIMIEKDVGPLGNALKEFHDHPERLNKEDDDRLLMISDRTIIAEIHQFYMHGYEGLMSCLLWTAFILNKNDRVRELLCVEINCDLPEDQISKPDYLDCFILELLRKYPPYGNNLVRTCFDYDLELENIIIPVGTPMHAHIYSYHNNTTANSHWRDPDQFLPERWQYNSRQSNFPCCPFMNNKETKNSIFSGMGFEEDTLDYFPFSAGKRMCLGKDLVVATLKKFIVLVFGKYQIYSSIDILDDELGVSVSNVIIPHNKSSLFMRVSEYPLIEKKANTGYTDVGDDTEEEFIDQSDRDNKININFEEIYKKQLFKYEE